MDRMYADNNELKVGDTVKSGKKTFRITGLVALSDYSALFQNNNDTMFDAVNSEWQLLQTKILKH